MFHQLSGFSPWAAHFSLKAMENELTAHWLGYWRNQRAPCLSLYCHAYVYAYVYVCVFSSFSCVRGDGGGDGHYVLRSLILY